MKSGCEEPFENSSGFKDPAVTSSVLVHMYSLNNAGTNDTTNQSERPAWLLCPRATRLLWEPLWVVYLVLKAICEMYRHNQIWIQILPSFILSFGIKLLLIDFER